MIEVKLKTQIPFAIFGLGRIFILLDMQLHISPSLRHVTVFTGKGVKEFIKFKIGSKRFSYMMIFYSLLFATFLLRILFVLSAMDVVDGDIKCSTIGNSNTLASTLYDHT